MDDHPVPQHDTITDEGTGEHGDGRSHHRGGTDKRSVKDTHGAVFGYGEKRQDPGKGKIGI